MKILFCCASLEAGRDGVGDYTMRLAEELISQGHECLPVALNDQYLKPGLFSLDDVGAINRKTMAVRLSSKENWRRRINVVQKLVYEFQPDWLSLQYVPYGYQRKGLPILFPRRLETIVGNFQWHCMFHELWIEPRGGLSAPLISFLQRVHIANLYRSIFPRKVHTSNAIYARKLARIGISASLLPLFSNIEKVPSNRLLRQKIVEECIPGEIASNAWIFLFFGSIHPGWDVNVFLERISNAARQAGKKTVILVSIGKNPCQDHAPLIRLRKIKTGFLHFREIGEKPMSEISHYLQAADFGVATTPLRLLGKSGSAAAMVSHGMPVVVPRIDVRFERDTLDENGILPLDEFFEDKLLNPPSPREFNSVHGIARLFLKTLDTNFEVQ